LRREINRRESDTFSANQEKTEIVKINSQTKPTEAEVAKQTRKKLDKQLNNINRAQRGLKIATSDESSAQGMGKMSGKQNCVGVKNRNNIYGHPLAESCIVLAVMPKTTLTWITVRNFQIKKERRAS
jgi:hypothetical protein